MTKEFIPYEQALALKELGFDEKCFGYYDPQGKFQYSYTPLGYFNSRTIIPLYQQAFRWFRDHHALMHEISPSFTCIITDLDSINKINYIYTFDHYHITDNDGEQIFFESYEEAELACLNKLIELVKQK